MGDEPDLTEVNLYAAGRWDAARLRSLLSACQMEYPWIRRDLEAPVAPEIVELFEEHHDLSLPDAYRSFLVEVSAGGAGPNYGLFAFDRSTVTAELPGSAWATLLEESDVYRTPFPHTDPWNPEHLVEDDDDDVVDTYFAEEETTGTWLVSDFGCAIWDFLVIKGSARGEIWRDQRTDGRGLYPLAPQPAGRDAPLRHSFDTWYSEWLLALAREQLQPAEIRVRTLTIPVTTWLARIIHNEIRGHDPEHRFLFAAGDSSRLFDLDRLDPSEHGPFRSLLESIARDLRTRETPPAPLHPDLTFDAAADFLDRVSAEIA